MFVDIPLDSAVSQRPLCGALVMFPQPLSLMFPYSRRVMIVLILSPYGVDSDGHDFGVFVPLPPADLIGFTQEAKISLEAAVGQLCFSVLCSSDFTHGTKAA